MARNVHKCDKRFFSHENSPFILFYPTVHMLKAILHEDKKKNLKVLSGKASYKDP